MRRLAIPACMAAVLAWSSVAAGQGSSSSGGEGQPPSGGDSTEGAPSSKPPSGKQGNAKGKGGKQAEPKTPPYATKIRKGIQLMVSEDVSGAIRALREAQEIDASKPDAHFYLGAALRRNDKLDDALESFREGARRAEEAGVPLFQARSLIGVADVLQRQARAASQTEEHQGIDVEAFEKARDAWKDVLGFAERHGSVLKPRVARTRMEALDEVLEQERKYVDVRDKIAKNKAEDEKDEKEDREDGGETSKDGS